MLDHKEVLRVLGEGPLYPRELAKRVGIPSSYARNALKALHAQGWVDWTAPGWAKAHRQWFLTDAGRQHMAE